MSVKKGPVTVLREKAKTKAMTLRMGNHRAVVTRTKSTFAEKVVALKIHRDLIANGCNPGPADTFHGDGLPDDSLAGIKVPKTMKERSDADKRKPITSEVKLGWTPRPFGWRKAAKRAA